MTRNEAFEILTKFVKSENLIRHHLACEAAMRGIYQWIQKNKKFPINPKDEEMWAITGLLHDADYELSKQHPEKHTLILEKKIGKKLDPGIMNAIKYHNFKYTKAKAKSLMDLAIYACDELTGLIAASALIHPDKKLSSLNLDFVMKVAAAIRFSAASVLGLSELLCDPTKITGTLQFSRINESAAAVTASVSVPCPTIIPWTPSFASASIAFASF